MIEKEDIQKLSDLVRITLKDEEKESLRGEINDILGYISEVNKVSDKGAKPALPVVRNVMREDGDPHEGGIFTPGILENVPKLKGDYIEVKRILG